MKAEVCKPTDSLAETVCEASLKLNHCSKIKDEARPDLKEHFESCSSSASLDEISRAAVNCSAMVVLIGAYTVPSLGPAVAKTVSKLPATLSTAAARVFVGLNVLGPIVTTYTLATMTIEGIKEDEACFNNIELKSNYLKMAKRKSDYLLSQVSPHLNEFERKQLTIPDEYLKPEFIKTLPCNRLFQILREQDRKQTPVIGKLLAERKINKDPRNELPVSDEDRETINELRKVVPCLTPAKQAETICAISNLVISGTQLSATVKGFAHVNRKVSSPVLMPPTLAKWQLDEVNRLKNKGQFQEAAWVARMHGSAKYADEIEDTLNDTFKNTPIRRVVKRYNFEDDKNVTEAYLVELENGSLGIFKPRGKDWKHVDLGTEAIANHHSEISAYEISRAWGLHLVPVTVEKKWDGMTGSLQAYVHGREYHSFTWGQIPKEDISAPNRIRIFDFLIGNTDRGKSLKNTVGWNSPTRGSTAAIDHGASFIPPGQTRGKAPTYLRDINFKDKDAELAPLFQRLKYELTPDKIAEVLRSRHPQAAIDDVIKRRENLIEAYEKANGIIGRQF